MTNESLIIDAVLRAWQFNAERIDTFFNALTPEQLEQEVAPGRNRLIYLWGHLAAVHDALFPLLRIGPAHHPQLAATFISSPDRATAVLPPLEELKAAWSDIQEGLWSAFSGWSPSQWLERHTAISEEDFALEPHRNRLAAVLARNTHMAFHYGQAVLTKPRE
jgi:hypothetical protein